MTSPFHPNQQSRLVEGAFDAVDLFKNSLAKPAPWESIVDFITHPSFCGRRLYPRQRTLYKLVFLETENMTAYDVDVIEEWRKGFVRRRDTYGVQPDIWERVEYLKSRGYRRFPHIQMVLGRRGSKGLMGGGLGAEQLAYFFSLDDWQAHYDIDPGQNGVLSVVATSQGQAQRFQFADVRRTVERCKYLQPHIATSKDYFFSIRTPADVRHIAEMKSRKIPIDHEIATLTAIALSSSSSAGRGGVGFANYYDEMAHLVLGTGSVKSGEEIYCLDPSTRVLCGDLTWRPIGDLEPGDKLVGYDEYQDQPGHRGRRRLREASVVGICRQFGAAHRITFTDGTSVVCSPNHRWLRVNYIAAQGGHNSPRWAAIDPVHEPTKRTTRPLRAGDHIKMLVEPWETDDSHDGGWLAGMLDGEGHISANSMSRRIGITQVEGPVLDRIQQVLKDLGFEYYFHAKKPDGRRPGRHGQKRCWQVEVNRLEQCLRLIGQFRPTRFLSRHQELWEGRTISNAQNVKTIAHIERVPDQTLVDIETTTKTFIAEGMVSHNSAWQPSLDQFGKDGLTVVPSSPFTKIGIFFKLYQDGSVLMPDYHGELTLQTEKSLRINAEEEIEELTAEPEMLILQLPSWGLYEDYERGVELIGRPIRRPIAYSPDGPLPENQRMARMEKRNPTKFKVERRAQFAEVEGAYLDPLAVEAMFKDPGWRPPLEAQARGYLTHSYRIHCDPSRTGANFALAVGHNEIAPCDTCGASPRQGVTFHPCQECLEASPKRSGMHWPHVVYDLLHVWRPGDFPPDEEGRRQIDYIRVMSEISAILERFPSTKKISFDQYDSALGMAQLRQKFSPRIQVAEVLFTEKENQRRAERFKSALNLGWMHAYRDSWYAEDTGGSLLEMEMKFLAERNGKVVKQDFGPVTTKDLFDSVSVVATELLKDALDRYTGAQLTAHAFGSTDVRGLQSGREMVRAHSSLGAKIAERIETVDNPARSMISANRSERQRRTNYQPTRAQSIQARSTMPRAGRGGRRF